MTDHDSPAPVEPRRPLWRRIAPEGRAAWLRAGVIVTTFLVIGAAAVSYSHHLERQRCEDTILSRGDLRTAIRRTVEVVGEETGVPDAEMAPLNTRVADVLVAEFGDPVCARRWDIDPATIRRDAGLPADPAEAADALGQSLAAGSLGVDELAPFPAVHAG